MDAIVTAVLSVVYRVVTRVLYPGVTMGPNVTRVAMYRDLAEQLAGRAVIRDSSSQVLSVSGSRSLCEFLGLNASAITEADFPDVDLLHLPFPDDSFDVLVTDQVLEHIAGDPFRAVEESCRVVRPGGVIVHTTCFYNGIHEHPGDYWRFTPAALRLMLEQHGRVLALGGWGSAWMPLVESLRLRYVPVPLVRTHPLYRVSRHQSRTRPITTWIAIEVS